MSTPCSEPYLPRVMSVPNDASRSSSKPAPRPGSLRHASAGKYVLPESGSAIGSALVGGDEHDTAKTSDATHARAPRVVAVRSGMLQEGGRTEGPQAASSHRLIAGI